MRRKGAQHNSWAGPSALLRQRSLCLPASPFTNPVVARARPPLYPTLHICLQCRQVYNLTTYAHLVGFFEALGVDTEPSEMSFSLSVDGGRLEWGSHGLDSVFAQRKNLASPAFLAMLYDVVRFGREAPEVGVGQWLGNGGAAKQRGTEAGSGDFRSSGTASRGAVSTSSVVDPGPGQLAARPGKCLQLPASIARYAEYNVEVPR